MSTTALVIGIALGIAAVVMVACIAIGLLGFNPERAQAIRDGEADEPVIVEEIRRIHVAAPDRFRRGRIDRHPFYIAPHLAAFGYAVCILAGAPVTNNVAALSMLQRLTMAGCFLIGATLVLTGSVMGAKWWRWRIVGGVHDHIAAARLGDDIRLPYTFAAIGMFAMGVSTGIYSTTSFHTTIGSFGGWLSGLISTACALMTIVFVRRIRQYSRTVRVVVDQAVANVILRGGHELE